MDSCRSWLVRMESVCRQFSRLTSEPVTLADGDQQGQEDHIDVVEVLNG